MKNNICIILTLALVSAYCSSCAVSESNPNSSAQGHFLNNEIKLETIRYRALYQKIKSHFYLSDASMSLQFLQSSQSTWKSDKRINESKYNLLLDLADQVCSEIDFNLVGLQDAYNTQELFYNLTGLSQEEALITALNIALEQSQSTSAMEKQELACMMLILDPRVWLKA